MRLKTMLKENAAANPSVVFREDFDDIAVLFDPDSGKTFNLNHTGVLIWKELDGKHTGREILGKLKENCDSIPDNVEEHLFQFIASLIENGLAGYIVRGNASKLL